MFIVVGMGPDPLLCCAKCGETVLKLRVTGEPMQSQSQEVDGQQSIFDQIK